MFMLRSKSTLWYALVATLLHNIHALLSCHTHRRPCCQPAPSYSAAKTPTALSVNFNWFTANSSSDEKEASDEKMKAASGRLGFTSMMSTIENLETAQRYGKLTAAVAKELAATSTEGVSPDGKVKVILNGQQRPVGISIDEGFFESSDVADVKQSVLAAMEEAYEKSIERMDERMKSYYKEIGL